MRGRARGSARRIAGGLAGALVGCFALVDHDTPRQSVAEGAPGPESASPKLVPAVGPTVERVPASPGPSPAPKPVPTPIRRAACDDPSEACFDRYRFARFPSFQPGQVYSASATEGLLANDASGAALEPSTIRTQRGGSVATEPDGSFRYSPPTPSFWGDDRFRYSWADGSAQADVRLTVQPRFVDLAHPRCGTSSDRCLDQKPEDRSGADLASDVNGDGFDDEVIWESAAARLGRIRIAYGSSRGDHGSMDAGAPAGAIELPDLPISSAALAGDVNGDGFADVLLGVADWAPAGEGVSGGALVVFGGPSGPVATPLAEEHENWGFAIEGARIGDAAGQAVAGAGDVNADGYDDVLVGAPSASRGEHDRAGAAYAVFGQAAPTTVALAAIEDQKIPGFSIFGASSGDAAGTSVASAGDFDGDGLFDIAVGARYADPLGRQSAGAAYVVFGRLGGARVALSDLHEGIREGFAIFGARPRDQVGTHLFSAGDASGDGLSDVVVVGALGEPHVVLGWDASDALGEREAALLGEPGAGPIVYSGGPVVTISGGTKGRSVLRLTDQATLDLSRPAPRVVGVSSLDTTAPGSQTIVLVDSALRRLASSSPGAGSGAGSGASRTLVVAGNADDRLIFDAAEYGEGPSGPGFRSFLRSGGVYALEIRGALPVIAPDPVSATADGYELRAGPSELWVDEVSGLLANDLPARASFDPFAKNREGGWVLESRVRTARGGHVTLTREGAFRYAPGRSAFYGRDHFNYTLTNGPRRSSARVTLDLWTRSVDLADVRAGRSSGRSLLGRAAGDRLGGSLAPLGDVNNDGLDDFAVGATGALLQSTGAHAPIAYVVWGRKDRSLPPLELLENDSDFGFAIRAEEGAADGARVASVGDVNGDGFDDVGVSVGDGADSTFYVAFGKADGRPVSIDPIVSGGSGALVIAEVGSLVEIGDVNEDGVGDYACHTPGTNRVYVVFGGTDLASLSFSDLVSGRSSSGYVIDGERVDRSFGSAVLAAGDTDADGFADLLVVSGALAAGRATVEGRVYLVRGKDDGRPVGVDSLQSSVLGRVLWSGLPGDFQFSPAGDVNGDGEADWVFGLPTATVNGQRNAGEAWVAFGLPDSPVDLSGGFGAGLPGFVIRGGGAGDRLGGVIASAGDVNDDGFGDLLVGAPGAQRTGLGSAGRTHLVLGKADGESVWVDDYAGEDPRVLTLLGHISAAGAGLQVASAGDFDDDGFQDLLLGLPGENQRSGGAYLLFGHRWAVRGEAGL